MGGSSANRLTIPDSRGNGAVLRVTRHSGQRKVVLSHWRDGVCVASTPIELSELPELIGVLADALGDALDAGDPITVPPGRLTSLMEWLRTWVRPRLAQITEFRPGGDGGSIAGTGAQPEVETGSSD